MRSGWTEGVWVVRVPSKVDNRRKFGSEFVNKIRNKPNSVGLRRRPPDSPLRMSTVWRAEMPGWRTQSLILSNIALSWYNMLPQMSF